MAPTFTEVVGGNSLVNHEPGIYFGLLELGSLIRRGYVPNIVEGSLAAPNMEL